MEPRDYVLEQIHHRETRPVPFTLPMEPEVAERVDAHYGSADWRQRLPAYMVSASAIADNPREAIGDTHERDAYGGIWRIDRRPMHLETPPLAEASFEGYDFPAPEAFFRPETKDKARQTCRDRADGFRMAYIGWGLFERSWNLRGFENVLMDAASEPDFFGELLDRLTDQFLAWVEYSADLDVDAIMFGDDWGDQRGVILGPDRWRRFLKPRLARIYEAAHAHGKIVISHCCGSIASIMADVIEIGLDVLESVQPEAAGMSPYALKAQWGDKIAFWGGLGSQSTLPFGTPDEVAAEIRRLCREMGRGGGYILAPAKPLQPETPTENAVAALEACTNQDA